MSCNSTDVTMGELLREDRLERGLTQKAAAREIGISREHYCRLENGRKTNPRLNTFIGALYRKTKFVADPCEHPEPHRHLKPLATKEQS